jgi:hypothetical protein
MANNTYTTSGAGTWTCPANVTTAKIEVWAAGAGGSNRGANGVCGGGGGGAFAALNDYPVIPTTVYSFSVGARGSQSGGTGGNSWFNDAGNTIVCQAEGGRGPGSNNVTGANGGAVANCTGDVKYAGGKGANGVAGTYAGGGGAAAGNAANGNGAIGYNGGVGGGGGGAGGNGRNTANGVGIAGSAPGGGGGGAWKNSTTARLGGYGANGQIIITYFPSNNIAANNTVHATLADNVTVVVSKPIVLSASNNIAAGGNNNTTAQLTAPANKTSGNNFVAGKISDDTNPLPSIDISANNYTEIEFCIKADSTKGAANNQVYNLRLTANGVAFNNYTANATWTIGVGGGATQINANNTVHATLADAGVLLQTHLIAANDTVHTAPTDAAVVLQTHLIVTADTVHATLADQTTAIATSVIAAADGTHATLADGATLLQTQIVVPADCAHATLSDAAALLQTHVIAPVDCVHATLSDEVTVVVTSSVTITAADCVHTQPTDPASILQTHIIAGADATHATLADEATITAAVIITPADCVHAQTADAPSILQTNLLTPASTFHAENVLPCPRNLLDGGNWFGVDLTPVQNQVGYDLASNMAWTVEDDGNTQEELHMQCLISDGVDTRTTVAFYLKKDSDESRFPDFLLNIYGNEPGKTIFFRVNTKTGASKHVAGPMAGCTAGVESYDSAWWRVWMTIDGGALTGRYAYLVLIPAAVSNWADTWGLGTEVGSIVVDEFQIFRGPLNDDFATFEQIHILIAEEAIHLQSLDIASILQTHLIAADDNAHAQLADQAEVDIIVTPMEITPDACVHGGAAVTRRYGLYVDVDAKMYLNIKNNLLLSLDD